MKRQLCILAFISAILAPAAASADMLSVWARGHGSYLLGPGEKLEYFKNNDAGAGYGFAAGVEVLYIDLFIDTNFHPAGSQWNMLGIGFDIDVMPGPVFIEPAAQVVYFFGKQVEGDGQKGLWPRIGGQAGVEFAKVLYVGVEVWGGYAISLPEPSAGPVLMGAGFFGLRFKAL